MTQPNEIRQQIANNRAAVAALSDDGAVLFNNSSCLAIAIPDGNADKGYITGLQFARIFTDAERFHGGNPCAGLDRKYSDGANNPFTLTAMSVAKRLTLAEIDGVLVTLDAALASA